MNKIPLNITANDTWKLVFEKQLKNQSSSVNISNLDDGAYLYTININKKKVKTDKLIIQH